jgi:hypothetical protein
LFLDTESSIPPVGLPFIQKSADQIQPALFPYANIYLGSIEPITNAPMTPGIQPTMVNMRTTSTAPHPLSKTAKGGSKIANNILPHPIFFTLSYESAFTESTLYKNL